MSRQTSVDCWVDQFTRQDIPVLRETLGVLAALRAREETVRAHDLARVILADPMLTLRVLRHMQLTGARRMCDITTIEHAIMMLGVSGFFQAFEHLAVVEDLPAATGAARAGLLGVVRRARVAALFARDWARVRHDIETEEVVVAALLHDVAEMLLWCFASDLAGAIEDELLNRPGMRSAEAQTNVIGFRLLDLQLALARAWGLPKLLLDLMDDTHAGRPRVRNVTLAAALARHAANGWWNPALPDDCAKVAELLAMPEVAARNAIYRVALDAASSLGRGPIGQATWLPPVPNLAPSDTAPGETTGIDVLITLMRRLASGSVEGRFSVRRDVEPWTPGHQLRGVDAVACALHGMHEGLGFERVAFLELTPDHRLATRYVAGPRASASLANIDCALDSGGLLSRLLVRTQAVRGAGGRRQEFVTFLEPEIAQVVGGADFVAFSVVPAGRSVGIVYGDRSASGTGIDDRIYAGFKQLCLAVERVMANVPDAG